MPRRGWRIPPVNRIDKNTSGLVLSAQHAYAAPELARNDCTKVLSMPWWKESCLLGPGALTLPIARQAEIIIGRCVTPERQAQP